MIREECPKCGTKLVERKGPVYNIVDITQDLKGKRVFECPRRGLLFKCGFTLYYREN
jgi:hypothetical protein